MELTFQDLQESFINHFNEVTKTNPTLFVVDVSGDELWRAYYFTIREMPG